MDVERFLGTPALEHILGYTVKIRPGGSRRSQGGRAQDRIVTGRENIRRFILPTTKRGRFSFCEQKINLWEPGG